LSNNKISK